MTYCNCHRCNEDDSHLVRDYALMKVSHEDGLIEYFATHDGPTLLAGDVVHACVYIATDPRFSTEVADGIKAQGMRYGASWCDYDPKRAAVVTTIDRLYPSEVEDAFRAWLKKREQPLTMKRELAQVEAAFAE